MNGGLTECDICDCDPCQCKEIRWQKEHVTKATELLKTLEEDTNELYSVLTKPKGLRRRLLKWLFPELIKAADSLRKCYWFDE